MNHNQEDVLDSQIDENKLTAKTSREKMYLKFINDLRKEYGYLKDKLEKEESKEQEGKYSPNKVGFGKK